MAVASLPSTAHLCLGAGGRPAEPHTIGIVEPAGRGRAPLYVVAEPSDTTANPELASNLIGAVAHEFDQARSRSVTSALTHALQNVNAAMHAENRRSLARDQ